MFGSSREYLQVFSKEVASRARNGMSLIAEKRFLSQLWRGFFLRDRGFAPWESRALVLLKRLRAVIGSRNPENRFPDSSRHHPHLQNHCPRPVVVPYPGQVVQTSDRGFLKSDRAHPADEIALRGRELSQLRQ